jgi:hypothetical protein
MAMPLANDESPSWWHQEYGDSVSLQAKSRHLGHSSGPLGDRMSSMDGGVGLARCGRHS